MKSRIAVLLRRTRLGMYLCVIRRIIYISVREAALLQITYSFMRLVSFANTGDFLYTAIYRPSSSILYCCMYNNSEYDYEECYILLYISI